MKWNEKTAAEATGGKAQGAWNAARVAIDSRTLQQNDLYVAIKGERFDGHEFVADALLKGAAAAVVSKVPKGVKKDAPLLIVKDTQEALSALGAYARRQSKAKFVGVTGSVGKTSTKEMIRLALSAHGATYATSGNFNNHIGMPLSLANMPEDTQFAVIEMGMNHAGEIAHLTKIVCPDVAVITTIEAVHLEFFKSVDAIADAKAEIFDGMKDGVAVLNADNTSFARLKAAAAKKGLKRIIACGESSLADCKLINYEPMPSGSMVIASIGGKTLTAKLGSIGRHWAQAALFTLAVGNALALDGDKTAAALAHFSEPEGRGRIFSIEGGAMLVDDSYNASPASMRAAFARTNEIWQGAGRKGRMLAALGDMLELGPEGIKLHQELAADLEKFGFNRVFTAGPLMEMLHEALPTPLRGVQADKAADLLPILKQSLHPGDILLVKGSHGSKMYELAAMLKDPAAKEKKHAV